MLLAATIALYSLSYLPSNHEIRFSLSGEEKTEQQKLQSFAAKAKIFCTQHKFDTSICFLLDMNLPSGQYRFFVYSLKNDSVLNAGIVAHGSCNYTFLKDAKFSNKPGCGCTALGKYKIGNKYAGRFGTAYKLYGLDTSNSNAYARNIVLHSYYLVPEKETYPLPVCNSLGCTMVSENFLNLIAKKIDASKKPVLLWVFD